MNNESQRIAIAEACGWTNRRMDEGLTMWHHPNGAPYGFVPDYLNDLNACHEMEKVLDADEVLAARYAAMIALWLYGNRFMMIRATAAQRCGAFLRTIGKWRDE